jgi:hypothetical protein
MKMANNANKVKKDIKIFWKGTKLNNKHFLGYQFTDAVKRKMKNFGITVADVKNEGQYTNVPVGVGVTSRYYLYKSFPIVVEITSTSISDRDEQLRKAKKMIKERGFKTGYPWLSHHWARHEIRFKKDSVDFYYKNKF